MILSSPPDDDTRLSKRWVKFVARVASNYVWFITWLGWEFIQLLIAVYNIEFTAKVIYYLNPREHFCYASGTLSEMIDTRTHYDYICFSERCWLS